jgi:hypothetical protein
MDELFYSLKINLAKARLLTEPPLKYATSVPTVVTLRELGFRAPVRK